MVEFPFTAVPELNGPAAILALGNGAFEVAVVERMVLDLDRQPLVMRIERRTARHRPGFEDAVEFQTKIVMQPRRVVLLDHEPPLFRWRYPDVAGRLVGLFEISFLSICGK